jgi:GTP-binding protein
VGKSTLISRVSAAKPKIADYPFTTLEPNLGVVRTADAEFVVADIPGLIEGAREGKGLGHQFLRHIERARVLVILCDLAPADGTSVAEQQRVLLQELEQYQPDLVERPRLVIGSRGDLVTEHDVGGLDLVISSVTGEGIDELTGRMATLVTEARHAEPVEEESTGPAFVLHRPGADSFDIQRDEDGSFVVGGREARRAVALSDLGDVQALAVAHGRLRRLGVDRALARAGAKSGDTVHIGDLAFEYEPSD